MQGDRFGFLQTGVPRSPAWRRDWSAALSYSSRAAGLPVRSPNPHPKLMHVAPQRLPLHKHPQRFSPPFLSPRPGCRAAGSRTATATWGREGRPLSCPRFSTAGQVPGAGTQHSQASARSRDPVHHQCTTQSSPKGHSQPSPESSDRTQPLRGM